MNNQKIDLATLIIVYTKILKINIILSLDKSTSNAKIEVIYDEPDDFRRSTANARDIELKDCPAYEKVQKGTHIELEHCWWLARLQLTNDQSCDCYYTAN